MQKILDAAGGTGGVTEQDRQVGQGQNKKGHECLLYSTGDSAQYSVVT